MKADKEANLEAAPTLCPLSTKQESVSIRACLFDVTIIGSNETLGHYSQLGPTLFILFIPIFGFSVLY